jgi:hypothetical protein
MQTMACRHLGALPPRPDREERQPEGAELKEIRARRNGFGSATCAGPATGRRPRPPRLLRFPGHDHPPFTETIGGVQHIAISVSAEQFAAARQRLDQAAIEYLDPDRGVDDSLYFRDPNGIGLEFYREDLGVFNGESLLR